jgi:ubiquinone/menaquinone biosynthesis C-methylase UbiE
MMSSLIYSGGKAERATAATFLEKRIEINHAYSSADFDAWLLQRLKVVAGEDVLDVGCGSGAQTVPFWKLVEPAGSVSSLDISAESVALLKSRVPVGARVEAVVADMAELPHLVTNVFSVKRYTLAHSSYALYYSAKRLEVLDAMRGALKPGGRCAVFTPNGTHGLVELAARYTDIPSAVYESLRFGTDVLEPYFAARFNQYDVHNFHNVVSVPSADILIEFFRQTTYYDAEAEVGIRAFVEEAIIRNGRFDYEKNGYLIIGFLDE